MAYADTIRTTDYTREELANLIDGNRFVGEAVTTAGTAPNYTVTLTPAPSAYATGQVFAIRIHSNLTTTSGATLNVNGLGAKDLKIGTSGNVVRQTNPYELSERQVYHVAYDGTDDLFRILNPTYSGSAYSFTSTISAPSGTPTIGTQTSSFILVNQNMVHFSIDVNVGLATATAAYLDFTLPKQADASQFNGVRLESAIAALTGYTSSAGNAFIPSATVVRIYRADGAAFPIDASFFIRISGMYMGTSL